MKKNKIHLCRLGSFSLAVLLLAVLVTGCGNNDAAPDSSDESGVTTSQQTSNSVDAEDASGSTSPSDTNSANSGTDNTAGPTDPTKTKNPANPHTSNKTENGTHRPKPTAPPHTPGRPDDTYTFSNVRRSCASFIQPWLVQSWNVSRWETEILNMKKAGMDFVILQSVADTTYEKADTQDPFACQMNSSSVIYPSSMPEFQNSNSYCGVDSLGNCLKACKKHGMKVMIGTISDSRLWNFGWTNKPTCPAGVRDAVNGSYMTQWIKQYAERSERMMKEIMQRYGSQYKDQIYGWYYNPEFWNISSACKRTDSKTYAQIIGKSLTLFAQSCTKVSPGKPMLLSPFINPSLSSPEQCGKMWQDVFSYTQFRNGDIFCPQDSFGNNSTIHLGDWYKHYKAAVNTKPGLKLWANNENFRTNYTVATLDSYIGQIKATEPYAERNICFSWNHYYSPELKNVGYNEAYIYYIKNGKMDTQAPGVPKIYIDGSSVEIISQDNIGICKIKVFKADKKTVVKENVCFDDDNYTALQTFNLAKGTYYAQTYDFFSNASQMVAFTVK